MKFNFIDFCNISENQITDGRWVPQDTAYTLNRIMQQKAESIIYKTLRRGEK